MSLLRSCLSDANSAFAIVKCALRMYLVILTVSLFGASTVYAERYSVEKDSFGNYNAKKVESPPAKEAAKPAPVQSDREQSELQQPDSDAYSSGVHNSDVSSSEEPNTVVENQSVETSENDSTAAAVETNQSAPAEVSEPRELSIFEKKYLEAEKAEQERILKAFQLQEGVESDYDATEVNPEEFIDSEELLRSPNKAIKERSPYYVTIDADGRPQTTFYDPTQIKEIQFTERNQKIDFTEAEVYKASESSIKLPESADPEALRILSGGQDKFVSHFETFSKNCCAQLPIIQIHEISVGNYHYFVINEDSLPYRFSEGDSRFLLVRLPYLNEREIPLRIRTFIRKFSERNIEKGVFFPQIITLDKNKNPLRMFTGPLLKFQEETWTTHAYLQGIFALSQTDELDERYLLINTTRETLASSSTIEMPANEKGQSRSVTLKHMNEGSFEIEILQ